MALRRCYPPNSLAHGHLGDGAARSWILDEKSSSDDDDDDSASDGEEDGKAKSGKPNPALWMMYISTKTFKCYWTYRSWTAS